MTLALPALAPVLPTHERWFVESQQAGDWSFFFSPLPLVLTAAVVAVTVVWRVLALRVDRPELPFLAPLGRLVPWVPRLLGHPPRRRAARARGDGRLHDPGQRPPRRCRRHRAAPRRGGARHLAGDRHQPPAGRGLRPGARARRSPSSPARRRSASARTSPRSRPSCSSYLPARTPTAPPTRRSAQLRLALLLLRLGVGTALIVLAFSEKLTNPAMAIDTLEHFPALDVFSLVGHPRLAGDLRRDRRRDRAALRPAGHLRCVPAGRGARRDGAVQRHPAALRADRDGRAPAGVRRLPRAAGLRLLGRDRRRRPVAADPRPRRACRPPSRLLEA